MKKQSKFLEVAIKATKEAEKIILKYYTKDIKANFKSDLSPVTKADVEAEKVIIKTIKKEFPSHGFLGEETVKGKKCDYLWIIDPIDGTVNYTRKIALFATQLALMEKGELVAGVSNAPVLKELMYAQKGKGAYLNGVKVKVSNMAELKKAHFFSGGLNYFKKKNLLKNLLSLVDDTNRHRIMGDFWNYHLLAQGKLEIIAEAGLKIWDIAALKVIIEEAGGMVTDLYGNKVNLETTSVLATNKKLHQATLKYFK